MDLTDLEKYPPLPGYAALGGRASFRQDAGRLRTVSLDYQGRRYTNFSDPQVEAGVKDVFWTEKAGGVRWGSSADERSS